jgi:hypothetical protein
MSSAKSNYVFDADELDPPPDAGISSSAKLVIFLFFFPDFAPPLAAKSVALFACSRAFRLSAFARATRRDECLLGGGIDFLLWEACALMCSNPPKTHGKTYRGPPRVPRTPARGPNGPAAVLWDTRGGAALKCAVSQNPAVLDQIFCRTPWTCLGDLKVFAQRWALDSKERANHPLHDVSTGQKRFPEHNGCLRSPPLG